MRSRAFGLALSFTAAPAPALGGEPERNELESVVVTASPDERRRSVLQSIHAIEADRIAGMGASAAADIIQRFPGAHVPVNSRGEAIVFLRNAGERQVGVFYEGAPLNVPWDNRVDLAMVPSAAIGAAAMAVGPASPRYGVNALGAISLHAPELPDRTRSYGYRIDARSPQGVDADGVVGLRTGRLALSAGAGVSSRDGESLSRDADLRFSEDGGAQWLNTDRRFTHAFARAEVQVATGDVALGVLYVDGRRGVAPESDRATGARFWRYPDMRHFLTVGTVDLELPAERNVNAAAWIQDFRQTIDSYTTASYRVVSAQERDKDLSFGGRASLSQPLAHGLAAFSGSAMQSTHRQVDVTYTAGRPPEVSPAELLYRQRTFSLGVDYQVPLSPRLRAEAAVGYDWIDFLRTGDKPGIDGFSAPVLRAGIRFDDEDIALRASIGLKSRMPTMRDLFRTALNRFLLNADLKPEQVMTAEIGASWTSRQWSLSITPFLQDVTDTLDQRAVGALRQRVNLKGSWTRGVEVVGAVSLTDSWTVRGDLTASRVHRRRDLAADPVHIAEKPDVLAGLGLDCESRDSRLSGGVEMRHVGRAYSLNAAGVLAPLRRSTSVNLMVGYRPFGGRTQIMGRIDNLTDTLVEPQIGLPAPGRTFSIGIRAPL